VEWLYERRAARDTVKRSIQALIQFNAFAQAQGATTWEELPSLVEPFVADWMQRRGTWCRTAHDRTCVRSNARVPVEQLLRLLLPDFVGTQRCAVLPFETSAPGFFVYLREERGLRPETLHRYRHHLGAFEAYLQRVGNSEWAGLSPALINAFIIESAQRLSPGGVTGRSGTLRVFLRYLRRQGLIVSDLSRAVPRGRSYRQASVPRSITWDDVERVLQVVDRRDPLGRRDYAMMLLLTSYGLRAKEVAALQLDDIDWPDAKLHVSGRKGGHSTIYPLSAAVGEAIVDYLRFGRPQVEHRDLFLTTRAPYMPISHWCASQRAGVYIRAAGVDVRRPGSHTFRHACVQRLVDADIPFKVIGDYVGHRTAQSTQVYGKVALHKLRELTLGEAEDVL
jgi:site-specific recombinase XerD